MITFQWVVEEGGCIRKGFLEKVVFGLGRVEAVGLMHRQYERRCLGQRDGTHKGTEGDVMRAIC